MSSQKATKFVATRCQILRLKCTKFNFGWGSALNPAGGAYSTHPDPLAVFNQPTSKGREGKGWEWEERGRKGRRGKEMRKEGEPIQIGDEGPPNQNPKYATGQ